MSPAWIPFSELHDIFAPHPDPRFARVHPLPAEEAGRGYGATGWLFTLAPRQRGEGAEPRSGEAGEGQYQNPCSSSVTFVRTISRPFRITWLRRGCWRSASCTEGAPTTTRSARA